MSQREPSVTVVIPVWDSPYVDALPGAVDTVRAQDPTVPVIVVDNASAVPVPTLEGVTEITSARRLTLGGARNAGLEHVETEFVVFLDADDRLTDGALEALEAGARADPQVSVFVLSLLESESGRRHRTPRRFVPALARYPRLFALATSTWSLYPINGCAILRVDQVRDAGGYADASGGEDWVLGASQAFRGRIAFDPRPGLIYHPGDVWQGEIRGARDVWAGARRVRDRLRADSAVPGWARGLVPVIALLQGLLIFAVRPLYRALRAPLSAARARRQSRTATGSSTSARNGRQT